MASPTWTDDLVPEAYPTPPHARVDPGTERAHSRHHSRGSSRRNRSRSPSRHARWRPRSVVSRSVSSSPAAAADPSRWRWILIWAAVFTLMYTCLVVLTSYHSTAFIPMISAGSLGVFVVSCFILYDCLP
jgi:hypothetical protein